MLRRIPLLLINCLVDCLINCLIIRDEGEYDCEVEMYTTPID